MDKEWISNNSNTVSFADFRVMHGGPVGRRLPEHEHRETQIEVHFRKDPKAGTESELSPGETVIIAPHHPHVGEWEDGSEVVVVLIPPIAFERAADEILVRSKFAVRDQNLVCEPLIHALGSAIRDQFRSSAGVSRLLVESTGHLLAEYVLRKYAETASGALVRDRFADGDLARITRFVDEGLECGVTVAEMAAAMKMGIHRFSRLLNLATGYTPYQFLQARRVQLAKTFLRDNATDLAGIASRLGFASQSHFCEVFRRATGLTPNAYRRARS